MSEKIVWSTVKIQVPSSFITVNKNGQIRIKPPLTKKGKIATANNKPAIEFESADVGEVKIINEGETKEFGGYISTEKKKRTSRFAKGSEEAKAHMKALREKRELEKKRTLEGLKHRMTDGEKTFPINPNKKKQPVKKISDYSSGFVNRMTDF